MPRIQFEGRRLELESGETVLDGLLRHGEPIPYSCKSGVCQSCLLRGAGAIPAAAQVGLKDTLRAQGYFLACCCRPESEIEVRGPDADRRIGARIERVEALSDTVVRVALRTDAPFDYRAGQFITLFREDGLARSYSLAGLPGDEHVELHVRLIPGGAMSGWLCQSDAPGSRVALQGPTGNCFYVPGEARRPILFAGAGTGLAPLYGILRDALSRGHTGPLWLFHGARTEAGLYLTQELAAVEREHPNVRYIRSVLEDGGETLEQAIRRRIANLADFRGYICGDAGLVNSLRKQLFLAGMASARIFADAFLPAAR